MKLGNPSDKLFPKWLTDVENLSDDLRTKEDVFNILLIL